MASTHAAPRNAATGHDGRPRNRYARKTINAVTTSVIDSDMRSASLSQKLGESTNGAARFLVSAYFVETCRHRPHASDGPKLRGAGQVGQTRRRSNDARRAGRSVPGGEAAGRRPKGVLRPPGLLSPAPHPLPPRPPP